MIRWSRLGALALGLGALALGVACSGTSAKPTTVPAGLQSPFTGYASAQYRKPEKWLCLPGRADACRRDLTATEIRADGSRRILQQPLATDAPVDCFYVYPTVDGRLFVADNHDDFSDLAPIAAATTAQAALFGQVCNLYVPLYRQVTLGTYFRNDRQREDGLSVAFSDVADAFLHYMGSFNRGRKLVLLGHSQGAEMVKRLLVRYFDDDPAMRERLLVALTIGGEFDVPVGRTVGGTFRNLPFCTADDEHGCIVAYRSHREDTAASARQEVPQGRQAICVNPGNLTEQGARAPLRAFIPALHDRLRGLEGVTTPYVYYPDLYSGRCVDGPNGKRVLEISESDEPGGMRTRPIDLSDIIWNTGAGTHIADFQFPQGDLIEMVARRARARTSLSRTGRGAPP
jgi:hypothetical protein